MKKLSQWQVATAAEAFAAAQFARCGWDVSVQYGANQPEYDLVAVSGDNMLEISVKGSQDGGWGLTQSHIKEANYHRAADHWLAKHTKKTVFCFVQFKGITLNALPRMYLATLPEVAAWLKSAAKGRGDTILYERHEWAAHAYAGGTVDAIPSEWEFTAERTGQLAALAQQGTQLDDHASSVLVG
jgi:Holliday junction resolvase-like predicted endonuclease